LLEKFGTKLWNGLAEADNLQTQGVLLCVRHLARSAQHIGGVISNRSDAWRWHLFGQLDDSFGRKS